MGVKYASASLLFNTRNVIGLSATPYNPKERDILIKGIFNEVIVKYGTYDFQPTIKFIKYNSELGDKYGKRVVWLWRNRFNQGRSIYNSKLHESETWIKTIYNITKNEVTNKNKIIIICMTKKQLHFISDYLHINKIKSAKLYSEENDIDKINDNVIIATYKYASHAFDHAELSRLIISVPLMGKKSLIQTIGRIVRRFEGKTNAIVYDLIDIDDKFRGIFTETIKNKINILNNEFDDCKFIET
jgi:superfamily II DNA or RNA helicase